MLYNPKWQAPKPWTLDHLIQWLETKEGHYAYTSNGNCMIAQYAKELGYKGVFVTRERLYYRAFGLFPIWKSLPRYFDSIASRNYTFKEALEMAKAIRTSVSPAPQSQDRPVASSEILERTA